MRGFRAYCEKFAPSNMDGILARDLNITPRKNDDKFDTTVSPTVTFSGRSLKTLNKLLGFEDDTAVKLVRVVSRNKNGVELEDITGECDKDLLNRGRGGAGMLGGRDNPHAACSPTTGQKFWISAKDWDFVRMHVPGGQGAGGGMGGMGGGMGGPPMGGPPMGGGMPPGAPPAPAPGVK